jgi:hypothetical protein
MNMNIPKLRDDLQRELKVLQEKKSQLEDVLLHDIIRFVYILNGRLAIDSVAEMGTIATIEKIRGLESCITIIESVLNELPKRRD